MIGLKDRFKSTSSSKWLADLMDEIKPENLDLLTQWNEIEGIEEHSICHKEELLPSPDPGVFPYLRGFKRANNSVYNASNIKVYGEKEANSIALQLLMKGIDYLVFDLSKASNQLDYSILFKDLLFEFIQVKIIPNSAGQVQDLMDYFNAQLPENCWFAYDHFERNDDQILETLVSYSRKKQFPFLEVNGFGLQQLGANCWQEVSFSLSVAHEYLLLLVKKGLTIDEASACLHFHLGVGSSFFYEISKFRLMRALFATMVAAYSPAFGCSAQCRIGVSIGKLNKSNHDQETNLLRETTEALSATSAGVDYVISHEIDGINSDFKTDVYLRMSRNVLSILKEESHLDEIVDPVGGSFLIASLTERLGEAAWKGFQRLEEGGGIAKTSVLENFLHHEVLVTREKRIQRLCEGKDQLVGINILQATKNAQTSNITNNTYLGIPYLSLEQEFKQYS